MRFGEREVAALLILGSIYGGAIVFANLAAAAKLEVLFLPWLIVPAGTIAYSVTFPVTDIVDEVYGRRWAHRVVWAGLAAELLMLGLVAADLAIPPAVEQMKPWELLCAIKVLERQPRIIAASIIAYLVSQHHDVWAFWMWRRLTRGRWLWLRNNASTAVSQLIDTTLFTTIAFAGDYPWDVIANMILTMWIVKLVIAALDTPLVYLGVALLQRMGVRTEIAVEAAGR